VKVYLTFGIPIRNAQSEVTPSLLERGPGGEAQTPNTSAANNNFVEKLIQKEVKKTKSVTFEP